MGILGFFDDALEKFLWNLVLMLIFAGIYFITFDTFEEKDNKLSLTDSIYFSGISHFTLGYGDITPKSKITRMIVVFHALLVWSIALVPSQF